LVVERREETSEMISYVLTALASLGFASAFLFRPRAGHGVPVEVADSYGELDRAKRVAEASARERDAAAARALR
jgi:hypothetical protein